MSYVKELTAQDFQGGKLRDKATNVVLFYSPDCGHCVAFKPAFEQFARVAPSIKVSRLNMSQYRGVNVGYQVEGFPTVVLYRNGVAVKEYTGNRTTPDLVKFSS